MEITKGMMKILMQVSRGLNTTKDIAKALKLSRTRISDVLSKLEKAQFIIKERKGQIVYIKLANTSFAREFRNLITAKPSIKFDDFLYGLNFRILSYCMFGWKSVKSIAKQLNLSEKTIRNRISIIDRGLLSKEEKLYRFIKLGWPILYEFLGKHRMFYLVNGLALWKYEKEVLFEVNDKKYIDGVLTGFSRYSDFDVDMGSDVYCCYLPKKKLSKEEIFVHSILEIEDARTTMLVLTFYLKHKLNKEKLKEFAMKYDCSEKLRDLDRLLRQEQTKVLSFIKEMELREFFKVYDINWKSGKFKRKRVWLV